MEDIMPKVSVIIPVYNTEKYLRQCLDSVVNQTLKDIEIICVDDGSTDGSLDILKEYASKDERFIILEQKNQGAGPARNKGLEIAKGEYLSFLDSDDIFLPNMLEKAYNTAISNHADVVCFQYNQLNVNTNEIGNPTGIFPKNPDNKNILTFETEDLKDTVFTVSNPMPWNKIISRELVIDNDIKYQSLSHSNDVYFTMCCMAFSKRVSFILESLVLYRYNRENSLKSTRDDNPFCFYEAYCSLFDKLNKSELYDTYKRSFLNSLISTTYWTYNHTDIRKSEVKNFALKTIFPHFALNKIENLEYLNKTSINTIKRMSVPQEIIISLTSYPARINTINQTIESLLNQSFKADRVILWLAQEQFPNREKDLPKQLLDLVPKGLTIGWYKDIKSYKKLIPTLKKYPDAIIVTADDDNIYVTNWLKKLYNSYVKYPKDIHAHRVTKFISKGNQWDIISGGKEYYKHASYLNKLTGVGGVLYPPHCFYKDILNEELIFKLAPINDDQWFWLQAALNGVRVRVVNKPDIKISYIPNTQETALCRINDQGEKLFWVDFNRIMNYYPKLKLLLKIESLKHLIKDILENIVFSVRNRDTHKVVTILGIRMKYKSKKLIQRKKERQSKAQVKKLQDKINNLEKRINKIDCLEKEIKNYKNSLNAKEKMYEYKLCKYMHPEMYPQYLKDWYKRVTGETLHLDNPQTFNEKIQWMKLYDSTPLKTRLADKYLVRDWVKEKIGEKYLIPLLGVWDNFDEIDFDSLPDKFVLKCNHGCGYNIIVTDKSKLDIEKARNKINAWMNEDYAFRNGLELHYSAIPRKIIAEQYLEELNNSLYDYRFFCARGKCIQIWLDMYSGTPNHKRKIYDRDWNELDINVKWPKLEEKVEKPACLSKMLEFAEKMSEDFYLVRIDFYYTNNNIYFGEMTFTSMSGTGKFEPEVENYNLGQMINLAVEERELVDV